MITISHPTASPTDTVTIKSPALGDVFTDLIKTNIHVSMSGKVVTTRRTPTRQRLVITIKDLRWVCDTHVQDLKTFLAAIKGEEVRITGLEDIWVGKFVTNPITIAYSRDRAELTLELIGTRTPAQSLLRLEDDSGYLLLEDGNYLLLEENAG